MRKDNTDKKIASLLLVLVLLCTACLPAMAEEPVFSTTAAFMKAMDEIGIIYTYDGLTSSGNYEILYITNEDTSHGLAYVIKAAFDSSSEAAMFLAWNLIEYDPANVYEVTYALNQINYHSTYAKFYADETDNTVTAERVMISSASLMKYQTATIH